MSGPLKFWLAVLALLLAIVGGAVYLGRSPSPPSEVTTAGEPAPAGPLAAQPSPAPPPAATKSEAPKGEATFESPFTRSVALWAAAYRQHMLPVARLLEAFERTAEQPREVCNALLKATYAAGAGLEEAPDPDVEAALRPALEHFAEAGKFCLQQNRGMQDTYLLLAKGGAGLAESMLAERYGESGVPGLAEPMEGGSSIGGRAVAFAQRAGKGQR